MSVLKSKRTESKAEYVNVANAIYIETINFLTRISARYSRLIAEPVAKLAGEVIDHAEKANSIYPSDDQRRQLRKAHLLEARASLMALDVRLTHCYLIMTQNPQGCFTTPSGKSVDAKKATERLDKMAQKLGELIDKENDLLQGMIGTVNQHSATGTAAVWWLRSPNYNNINNNNYFCAVSSSGSLDYNNANNAYGVVPGFCNAWSHGVAIGERRP